MTATPPQRRSGQSRSAACRALSSTAGQPEDVQSAIRAARDCDLPLSVRGGGHDWAGRALCDGIVIDLSGMNGVVVASDNRTARISGGARASDVLAVTDPLRVAAVAGSFGAVGMAGFTLGGGYGALIGRFGLALDNLLAAEVVLADGRIVVATHDHEEELFWALAWRRRQLWRRDRHAPPSARSAQRPLGHAAFTRSPRPRPCSERCADIAAAAPEDLTVQVGCVVGPDGAPVVMVVPTWCGPPEEGEARIAPFLEAWNAARRRCGRDALRRLADLLRPVYRLWATHVHGDVLAACARQRQHRRLHPGDGDGGLPGLRHLHPRVQGRRLARTGGGDRLRPSPRPCARRDSRHVRRSVGQARGATASPVGQGHPSGL